jgi:hypothetical protein
MARIPIPAVASIALLVAPLALAEGNVGRPTVWKCLEGGRSHYTNIRKETEGKDCTVVSREISVVSALPPVAAAAPASARPANFPRIDRDTQRSRDEVRRRILEEELSAEERNLAEARAKLAEQEGVRDGNERNYQKVLDRLQPLRETVDRHERNISALMKEIAALK